MKKYLSLLLTFLIPFTMLTGMTIVKAASNVDINISFVKDPAGSNSAYIERIIYPNQTIGAEIRMKNNGSQSAIFLWPGTYIIPVKVFLQIIVVPGTIR